MALLAGTDFFTAEVLTLREPVTYYLLRRHHHSARRAVDAAVCPESDIEVCGSYATVAISLHDRDTKYTQSFRAIIVAVRVEPLVLPARSPNLNAYAERWVRSVKEECLSKVILFGERALSEYLEHCHAERNYQGKNNVLLFPRDATVRRTGPVQCREQSGGLLRYCHQEAA